MCGWLHSVNGNFSPPLPGVSLRAKELGGSAGGRDWPDAECDSHREETGIYKSLFFFLVLFISESAFIQFVSI